ncbi:MAG TPA: tRNA pseudouridine(55) synthase TruB [Candidatus Saccharimonadales bacterium]|nr:tRNA pseudouridine(55) synthase TruB [Candidatus Saccharimonadales bacterium]
MLGVINLDKPVGPTSHDMVGLVRRLTGTRRIGHAGTLDPLASGVLPILVGAATRFSEELSGGSKQYDAVVRLGQRSVTDDAQGPLEPGGTLPERGVLEAAVAGFVGTFGQRPPAYSARKQDGLTAYRAARAGRPMELAARMVTVHAIELLGMEQGDAWLDVRLTIRCGPGTYIRAIARDLGERLGSGGHLHALRRTEAAGLDAADAISPPRLELMAADGRVAEAIIPVATLLSLPRLVLDMDGGSRFAHGSAVEVGSSVDEGRRAVFSDEQLLGIGMLRDGMLHPEKVIAPEAAR